MQLTLHLTFDPGLVLSWWRTSSCVSLPILVKIDAPAPKFCIENHNMPPNNTGVNGIFGFSARFFQCMLSAFWPAFWNQRELRLDLWLETEETAPFNNFLPLWARWPKIGVIGAREPSVAFLLEGSVLSFIMVLYVFQMKALTEWGSTKLAYAMATSTQSHYYTISIYSVK